MNTLFYYFLKFLRLLGDLVTDCFGLLYTEKKNYLQPITDPVLLQSTHFLIKKVRSGQLKSEHLVRSYINRIKQVNSEINALIGERFDSAIEEAKEWDRKIANSEAIDWDALPLLGIPVSIKEQFAVKDMPFTGGLVSRKDIKATKEAKVVQNLRQAGAIPIGVTNVPEYTLFWDTFNKNFGHTNNPYDKSRISGGSSGGEAALISAAGSLLGVGTDLGGSIRMPSFFCGVFGHKPSAGVVPIAEIFPPVGHEDREPFIRVGPICRYACDLRPMMKACAGADISRIDIDKELDLNELKVYFMKSDSDPLKTAVSEDVFEAMQRVIEFMDTITRRRSEEVNLEAMNASFWIWLCNMLDNDAPPLACELTERKGRINGLTEIIKWVFGKSNYRFATSLNVLLLEVIQRGKNTERFRSVITKGDRLREDLTKLLGNNGVLIYPTLPETAPKHMQTIFKGNYCGYSMVFNITGNPVTQCPLGLTSEGMPVGLQIVTAPHNDHLSIGVAELLEKQFGGWVPPCDIKLIEHPGIKRCWSLDDDPYIV